MISVEEALARIFARVTPLSTETVGLAAAAGRVLRAPVRATRDQPPFPASAMDGYAVGDPVRPGQQLRVVGEAAAGHAFDGQIRAGEACRIFTGAPVPPGATRVVIQEDVERRGDLITLSDRLETARYIRPQGTDFKSGFTLDAPHRLTATDLALIAAMNAATLTVGRRPDVAIITTGDELVMPGETPRADQIIASNAFALKAMAEGEGATARILPIAQDTEESLRAVFALAEGADLIVTVGGASVGDHDLVGPVLESLGASRAFYKVAIRPGKPLMAGALGAALLLGLPGNPVSSIVCAHLFMRPVLRALQGLEPAPLPRATAALGCDLPRNGPRAHFMRATLGAGPTITPLPDQDSALLTVLSRADALLIQPAQDGPREAGEQIEYISLDAC